MVYLIQVGNYSRRQSFIKLYEKAVLIDDKYTQYDIDKYFQEKYEGFTVIARQIKEVEPVKDIRHNTFDDECGKPEAPERISAIKYFKIKYTDEEKKLHDSWENSVQEAHKALRNLHSSIEKCYAGLFYSNFDYGHSNGSFKLETTSYGTKCINFPVIADLFIEAAKECNGTVPEKVPSELPENNTSDKTETEEPSFPDDVPF
jgi:hypothetical protein